MTQSPAHPEGTKRRGRALVARPGGSRRAVGLAVGVVGVLLAATVFGYYGYFQSGIGLEQPIPFSHRFHVTEKRVSCIFCHPGVVDTPRADVPMLATCMLCHQRIIVTYPPIARLRRAFEEGRPVPWVRVNHVPEFVYFNHEVHVRKGFDCSRCHGDVARMDRVVPAPQVTMGFCVQCHRDENFSHDCLVCHR